MSKGPVDTSTTFEGCYPPGLGSKFKGKVDVSDGRGTEGTSELSGDLEIGSGVGKPIIGFDIGSADDELLDWVEGGLK